MREIERRSSLIFLSDKYLRSPYCMFELFELWRNSRQNKEEFLRRVRFFTIDGTKIQKPSEWLEYAKFWKRERDELRQAIDEAGLESSLEKRHRSVFDRDTLRAVVSLTFLPTSPTSFSRGPSTNLRSSVSDGQLAAERMN